MAHLNSTILLSVICLLVFTGFAAGGTVYVDPNGCVEFVIPSLETFKMFVLEYK